MAYEELVLPDEKLEVAEGKVVVENRKLVRGPAPRGEDWEA